MAHPVLSEPREAQGAERWPTRRTPRTKPFPPSQNGPHLVDNLQPVPGDDPDVELEGRLVRANVHEVGEARHG